MVNTNRFKAKRSRARRERAEIRNKKCLDCGKDLTDTLHHFYCNEHWKLRHQKVGISDSER